MSKICKFFSTKNKAIIALGSNMGNRFKNLSTAADLLRRVNKIVKTSQIYENPSYDNNQILLKENMFFNAAVQIETELNCEELLQYCKAIERALGREKKMNKQFESRTIDLDILFYNNKKIQNKLLTVPHPRIENRPFVLKTLNDILVGNNIDSKFVSIDVKNHLEKHINGKSIYDDNFKDLNKIIYIKSKDLTLDLSKKQYLTKSINCKEANAVERGIYKSTHLKRENDHARVLNHIAENHPNVDILEISGDNDTFNGIPIEVEIIRATSMIESIKRHSLLSSKVICVKTKNHKTAKEVIKCGADIIYDESGMTTDSQLAGIVATSNIPIIFSFNRSATSINSFQKFVNGEYNKYNFIEGLRKRINHLTSNNINNWNIIVDLGINHSIFTEVNKRLSKLDEIKSSIENTIIADDLIKTKNSLKDHKSVNIIRSNLINDQIDVLEKTY